MNSGQTERELTGSVIWLSAGRVGRKVPGPWMGLAALRAAVAMDEPYGPPGGLPEHVRIDRGKDFLSQAVASVLAGFAVATGPLPGYTPHLKGSVETVNGAMGRMFAAGLPATRTPSCRPTGSRWTRTRRRCGSRPAPPSCWVLRREPMLSSRVYVWQEFRRLDREQVLAVIPTYHPVWAAADPADIAYADARAGHGNFRGLGENHLPRRRPPARPSPSPRSAPAQPGSRSSDSP